MIKATRNIIIGVILGSVIGWALGFLRLPYLEKNYSFLIGFIACLAFVALVFILVFVWNKHSYLLRLLSKNSTAQNPSKTVRTYTIIWILIATFILFDVLVGSFYIYKQKEYFVIKTQIQNKKIREHSELIESSRRSNMLILLNEVLDKVDDDLKNNGNGKLSDKTIASIVEAFNYTFVPYSYFEGDSLSTKKLSPEKGQLLLALCRRNIDTNSFSIIKLKSHFSGADIKKGDLHGVDLSGADFKNADLSYADLSGTNFNGADFRNANLWGAHANNANFFKADMRRAIMCWAEMNGAQLDSVNLNGADLSNGQFRSVDLRNTTLRAAKLEGALLKDANMEGVLITDASMKRANLTNANLTAAYAYRTNFNEAIMIGTELTKMFRLEKDWFDKVNKWRITGAKEIHENYKLVEDTVIQNVSYYHLEKK